MEVEARLIQVQAQEQDQRQAARVEAWTGISPEDPHQALAHQAQLVKVMLAEMTPAYQQPSVAAVVVALAVLESRQPHQPPVSVALGFLHLLAEQQHIALVVVVVESAPTLDQLCLEELAETAEEEPDLTALEQGKQVDQQTLVVVAALAPVEAIQTDIHKAVLAL